MRSPVCGGTVKSYHRESEAEMYTSGRTVKSRTAQRSPIAQATADARRLVRNHLPAYVRPTISSKMVAGTDGTVRIGVSILFTDLDRAISKPLADAVTQLPRYHSMCWNLVSVSYLIEVA